jgi:hypothetical protein
MHPLTNDTSLFPTLPITFNSTSPKILLGLHHTYTSYDIKPIKDSSRHHGGFTTPNYQELYEPGYNDPQRRVRIVYPQAC